MATMDMTEKDDSLASMLATLRQFTQPKPVQDAPPVAPPAVPVVHAASPVPAQARSDGANLTAARRLLERINVVTGFRSSPSLERKLAQVLRNVTDAEIDALLRQPPESASADLAAIVEDLTNHETFFFRDTMQLDPLTDEYLPELIKACAKRDKRVRIWSAACATGEETYTLAILALNALCAAGYARFSEQEGFVLQPGWSLEVLGTDISRQAVRIAKAGSYLESGFGAFRQMPGGWQRYFRQASTGAGRYGEQARYLSVLPSVSRCVRFETFNLMSRNPPLLECDLVLCRNVLIYIDIARHPGVYDMIFRSMRPGGIFVPSLVDQVAHTGFKTRWSNRCAFYEKR